MTDSLLVFCTCQTRDQSLRLAHTLLDERLAACVNILPPIQSIYRWQDAVERADEILLLIKTTRHRFAALETRIRELHTYDTPEVIAIPIAEGSERYLAWLVAQV